LGATWQGVIPYPRPHDPGYDSKVQTCSPAADPHHAPRSTQVLLHPQRPYVCMRQSPAQGPTHDGQPQRSPQKAALSIAHLYARWMRRALRVFWAFIKDTTARAALPLQMRCTGVEGKRSTREVGGGGGRSWTCMHHLRSLLRGAWCVVRGAWCVVRDRQEIQQHTPGTSPSPYVMHPRLALASLPPACTVSAACDMPVRGMYDTWISGSDVNSFCCYGREYLLDFW
jgi:hypothetical protein